MRTQTSTTGLPNGMPDPVSIRRIISSDTSSTDNFATGSASELPYKFMISALGATRLNCCINAGTVGAPPVTMQRRFNFNLFCKQCLIMTVQYAGEPEAVVIRCVSI